MNGCEKQYQWLKRRSSPSDVQGFSYTNHKKCIIFFSSCLENWIKILQLSFKHNEKEKNPKYCKWIIYWIKICHKSVILEYSFNIFSPPFLKAKNWSSPNVCVKADSQFSKLMPPDIEPIYVHFFLHKFLDFILFKSLPLLSTVTGSKFLFFSVWTFFYAGRSDISPFIEEGIKQFRLFVWHTDT